jgi:16S rRNA C967 or C1407 C5-methylase (RsmB/RsmF family)
LNTQLVGQDPKFAVLSRVDWMVQALESGKFFKLDAAAPMSSLPCYKDGSVYGIDLSSAAAVAALDVQPHHHVLDLCCAPGAKLALIFDRMWAMYLKQNPAFDTSVEPKQAPFDGTVTGVDVSAHRLQACRSLCQKYKLSRIRLFLCDGSQFYNLAADPSVPVTPSATSSEDSIFLPPLPQGTLFHKITFKTSLGSV